MSTHPTGQQVELTAGGYRAVVVQVGGGIRTLDHEGRAVVEGYAEYALPDGGRGQLLLPWPNRIDGGRYTFGGQDRQLDVSEPALGNATHGLTRWVGWDVVEQSPAAATLRHRIWPRPGYPHLLDCQVDYVLDADDGLRVRVAATNAGETPAPYATGVHPYLTVGSPLDVCELHLPAATWLPVDERMLPTGHSDVSGTAYDFRVPRLIGGTVLDTCFTDLEPGDRVTVTLRGPDGQGAALWLGDGQPFVQLYSGDTLPEGRRRTALAVEPMTAPANAFVSGDGLVVLAPGETHTVEWGIARA
jgi:aldose 1-epimerase